MMLRTLTLLLTLLLAACSASLEQPPSPQPEIVAGYDLNAPIPVDPALRQGTLANGLRYYIRENRTPPDRVDFRLVIKAGSIHEDDDQIGLAHVLEHMAFNGTRNFPGTALVEYLESTGNRFGAHLNARTGFETTVYQLQVPADDPAQLSRAFTVLADWAWGLTLDPTEIEMERGVVLEEWRERLGVGQRIDEATRPLVFAGSRFAERLPIGTEQSLQTFSHDALRRFYRDWYRPDRMAVIVVGDIDATAVEDRIRRVFSEGRARSPAAQAVDARIPDQAAPAWISFSDPEITLSSLRVTDKRDFREAQVVGDVREQVTELAALTALNIRLARLGLDQTSPVRGAAVGQARLAAEEGG
jgi:zinc protease